VKPRRTHASNKVLRLPGGNEDNDLWIEHGVDEGGMSVMCSVWEPTAEERAKIAAGENVELLVWGDAHPPVAVKPTDVPLGKPPQD
jgi:hypothetical protein